MAKIRRGDLIHYTDEPLHEVSCIAQETHAIDEYRSPYDKPQGLWVSVLGPQDWASWCRAENFRRTRSQCATRVHLRAGANILRLSCASEIDEFTNRFGVDCRWSSGTLRTSRAIEWSKVAAAHQGIIIAPYVWESRLSSGWYYGWDCASGCIWDAAAIEDLELVRGKSCREAVAA